MLSLADVFVRFPEISASGFRTSETSDDDHDRERFKLFVERNREITAALKFLDGVEIIETSRIGIQLLTHIAQRHQNSRICNGAMIVALLMAGVSIERAVSDSPHVLCCICPHWIETRAQETKRWRYV
ncbi:hypothetical protein [Bordetella tumulicola]|uniref:hypothetical protein n=1 Tax=Bordetella tumulicola TaxID=1649133 RepID=UPI0039EE3368